MEETNGRGTRKKRILIIEDDAKIVDLLTLHLSDMGFDVLSAGSGTEGRGAALRDEQELIILDIMLPGMDGLEVCKAVRGAGIGTPILMLTAKSEEVDKVLGLELGADDYITKPFSIRELLARVKALLRRSEMRKPETDAGEEVLCYGPLSIDTGKRTVTLEGKTVDLTAKEYDLLVLFARNPGRAFDRQQLLDLVWGYSFIGYQHTVNSHINRLRGKIEKDPSNPVFLKTVWGYGYRFAEADEIGG